MKRFFAIALVAALAIPAFAADVTNVNPSNVIMDQVPSVPVPVNGDPVCGELSFDGVNGYAAARRPDGLESWVLANCEDAGNLGGMCWLAIDNTDADWDGTADYAVWDAATVEGGCADDSNTICAGRGIANTRDPLLDGSGNQVILFGRLAWTYCVKFDECPTRGKIYVAPRVSIGAGQSFILTRACNGDKPTYFQSAFFGYPCAVPANQLFGVDACNAIQALAGGPAAPRCTYQITARPKLKSGICGQPCNACPYNQGDLLCTVECDTADQCRATIKGFNACNGGGACKVKAGLVGCAVPNGCKRCG
jgi:hypothetical protein